MHHEGLGPREGGRGKLETGKGAEGGVRKHQSQARGASKDGQRGGGGGHGPPHRVVFLCGVCADRTAAGDKCPAWSGRR